MSGEAVFTFKSEVVIKWKWKWKGKEREAVHCFSGMRLGNFSQIITGFTGESGGLMAARTDFLLRAPSNFTPVIQQIHMVAGHMLCALVERAIHPKTM